MDLIMTNEQAVQLSRIANGLLAELSDKYAQEYMGQSFPWEQAQQLVLDAFEAAHRTLSPPPGEVVFHLPCGYCGKIHEQKDAVVGGIRYVTCPEIPEDTFSTIPNALR